MQNLITRSNQPSLWNNLSGVTATDNVAIAPDGTLTAGRVVATGGGGVNHFAEQTNTSMPQPGANYARVKTSAIFVKADTTTKAVVGNGRHSNWYRALIDLSNGVVDFTENCKASLRYVGGGWWRCSVTYVQLAYSEFNPTQDSVMVAPVPAAQTGTASIAFSQSGEAVFVWGAQLSLTSGPTVFVPTGAKIVEGRARRMLPWQNLVPVAEDATLWAASAGTTVTANAILAPNGTLTADRVQWTAGAVNSRYCSPATGSPVGFGGVVFKTGVYTVSVWLRTDAAATVRLRLPLVCGVSNQDSPDIVVGPTWTRVRFTARVTGPGAFTSVFLLNDSTGAASDFHVWGMQVTETNGFAEYIPTTTRAVDEGAPRSEILPLQLCKDTEDLTTASWTAIGTVTRTLLPGAGLGRFNATRLDDQSAAEYRGALQYIAIPADQRAYTVSIDIAKTSTTPAFGINITLLGGTTVSMQPRLRPSDGAIVQTWFSSVSWAYVEDLGTHWRVHATIHNNGTNTSLAAAFYAAVGTVYTADSVTGTGYADVGRVSITATRGPVDYVPNGNTASPYLGNGRARRLAQNALQISNLNNAAWNLGGVGRSVGPVFPGGRVGIKLTEDVSGGAHYTGQTIVPPWLTGRRVTVCVKVLQGSAGRPWAAIGGNGGNVMGWLNTSTGVVQTPSTGCETRARRLSDGSWLMWFTFPADSALPIVRFYMAGAYAGAVYAGDGVSFMYFADAQLVDTDGEPEFAESTRAIQGAVNEGLGSPRRFLGRQNTITAPNDFGSGSWAKSQATIVDNIALAPNGTMTADRLVDNATNSLHYVTQAVVDPLAIRGGSNPRGLRTWSIFAKADTMSGFLLAVDNTNQGAYFDLALGVVALPFTAPGGYADCRPVTTNGWYRCSVTADVSVAGSVNPLFATSSDPYAPIGAYSGSGTGVLIWGAQCSAGAGPVDFVDTLITAEGHPRSTLW